MMSESTFVGAIFIFWACVLGLFFGFGPWIQGLIYFGLFLAIDVVFMVISCVVVGYLIVDLLFLSDAPLLLQVMLLGPLLLLIIAEIIEIYLSRKRLKH